MRDGCRPLSEVESNIIPQILKSLKGDCHVHALQTIIMRYVVAPPLAQRRKIEVHHSNKLKIKLSILSLNTKEIT
jgi:hypothetical protein